MFALTNEVRRYAWGSHTAMADFLGQTGPSTEPEAELWVGAYPTCPSRLADGRSLAKLIAEDPAGTLGAVALERFGPRLPFLMKVLTIGAPLSLQAHPNAAQAAAGFAAEEAAGIPLDAPVRNYRDGRHKPELLCALTQVEAFCGFRPVSESVALLDELAVPELDGLRQSLTSSGLEASVRWIFELSDAYVADVVAELARSAAPAPDSLYTDALQWGSRLAQDYPGDRGVVLTLLCTFVRLAPDEALFIPAGCLHAYLSGMGVEIMAESDNVLRGGLTGKHVDVLELQRVLDFGPSRAAVVRGQADEVGRTRFATEVEEFALSKLEVSEPAELDAERPAIVLTVDGAARLRSADGRVLDLPQGRAAFLPAVEQGIEISGSAVVFEATTGPS